MNFADFYRKMYKIRKFEEKILQLFSENKLSGTTHTCIGQEACAVAVMNHIAEQDIVFSNHRCHGHFIAYSDDVQILLAEIMGKRSGVCQGRGGSQHLCYKRFFSNGIQGGIVPNAVGMAWAEKLRGTDNIAVVFLGDGTLGQGVAYESFNMASAFEIPILFVIENNEYAMTTKRVDAVAGSIKERLRAFDIKCAEEDDSDIEKLDNAFKEAISYVRTSKRPYCQIINTYRLAAHSKGDDFRDAEEVKARWEKDPLKKVEMSLETNVAERIRLEVEEELEKAVQVCEEDEMALQTPEKYSEKEYNLYEYDSLLNVEEAKIISQINRGLQAVVKKDKEVLLMGEDIRDPYGGAFKATKGISEKFSEQVINTPISEAAMVGIGVGLAMNGMKPIVEMMFGDFISLGFDQILNHATKYNWMYAGQVNVPLLIRVPSGGGRGYGATHSQTLEKYLVGVPNLKIIAASPLIDNSRLIERIADTISEPVLLVENKKMYTYKSQISENGRIGQFYIEESKHRFPMCKLSLVKDEKAEVTIVTYGEMITVAMQAAKELLLEEDVVVNVVALTMISPVDCKQLQQYVNGSKYVFTLEEGTKRAGWGAEVVSSLCEMQAGCRCFRVAAENCVISCNKNEEKDILPSVESVIKAIKGVVYGTN